MKEIEKLKNCDQPPNVLDALKEIIIERKGFLVLAGKNGTGKTYAAKCVYNHCNPYRKTNPDARFPEEAIYKYLPDFNSEWIGIVKKYGEADVLKEEMKNTKMLVLDDLGSKTPTEAFLDFIFSIINYRYDNELGTVITTNMNVTQMRELYGDRIVSRIASDKAFRLEGPDRRFKEF